MKKETRFSFTAEGTVFVVPIYLNLLEFPLYCEEKINALDYRIQREKGLSKEDGTEIQIVRLDLLGECYYSDDLPVRNYPPEGRGTLMPMKQADLLACA